MNKMRRFETRFEVGEYLRKHELKHHVYMLMHEDLPIYVGISNNWKRIYSHFSENKKRTNVLLRHKMRKVARAGGRVEIVIVSHFHSILEADHAERSLILLYGKKIDRTGILCNLSDGGTGKRQPCSQRQKEMARIRQTGRLTSDETRLRSSVAQKKAYAEGKRPSFLGRHHTEEAKKKLSEAHSGENNKYFGVTGSDHFNYGKRRTDEQKERIAAGQDPEKMKWDEDRKGTLRQYWENQPLLTCPHCGKQSSFKAAMIRYHFDSCKHKLILQN